MSTKFRATYRPRSRARRRRPPVLALIVLALALVITGTALGVGQAGAFARSEPKGTVSLGAAPVAGWSKHATSTHVTSRHASSKHARRHSPASRPATPTPGATAKLPMTLAAAPTATPGTTSTPSSSAEASPTSTPTTAVTTSTEAPTIAVTSPTKAPAAVTPSPTTSNTTTQAPAPVTTPAPAPAPAPGIFGLPLSTNPYDAPSQQLRSQSGASSTTTGLLARIAGQPIADWYGGSTSSVEASVAYRVDAAAKQNAVSQLVVYNLPNRDCEGGYSASTLSADQYRTWFRTFMAGLGTHRAIVILEPDALMQIGCLNAAQQSERYSLMSWATGLLAAQGSWTYIDAGHSAGLSVSDTAARLNSAGVANAAGFSLNVSNYRSDAESIDFGTAVSQQVGGKHFVIDSSRNGVEPQNSDWCNPANKGLGHRPTTSTGVDLLDAYLWVKTPGSSDGTCNGGPSSGAWWQSYALMLAQNAVLD